ncbi:MAG TPA: thioredoxin domain-containing protein, partial [Solirubrobacteraceae bacterium]
MLLVLVLGGGSPSATNARESTAQSIDALLAGIPEHGDSLGNPSAPVTIQFYGDLECSTTRGFTLQALPSIIQQWVRTGQVRIEYRSLRTVSEPEVFSTQQVAALAAGMQNKLWYYLEAFYHEQGTEHT